MEEEISRMKIFLTEFNNEQIQSPTSEERIGNYALDPEDVVGQVIDWVLNYLDNRKCPYSLALTIAKEIAQQISVSFSHNESEDDTDKNSNAANIYAEAIGKIPDVCNAFSNQDNLESICSTKYATSVFAIKNKRRKMEDRHVIHHDLNALLDLKNVPHQSYYAVFDGHSGIDAACYASAQLHVNIAKHPDFFTDTPKAISEGYQITDLNFLNKCNKWNIKSGCTAVCALIRDNTLFLSWLGDSQGVLVKEGVPLIVTVPHKPDREDERRRIESLGGHISHMGTWRVNGLLAVTRAIGDPDQKQYISSEPEITVVNLDGTEDFLILACDGLWDGLSPEDVTGVLYRYLADSSLDEPVEAVAAKLVHQSKLQGSEDNITTIVVFLRDIKDIKENAVKFLSNSSFCLQNPDFMSMNGNMKMFSMEHNSDTPFSKPTVLELNAASSKKLKNAANVMSSTGFGSASYSYQCVEQSAEGSFQGTDPSVVDNAQNNFMSQNVSASCFAPEATALSELPTPPIDDVLASQQFENFYSTDLYKELNNSVQSSQNLQSVDVIDNKVVVNSESNEPSLNVDFPSQIDDIVADVSNMSLLDTENNSITNPDSNVSPNEAVGIASTVVSTTIETAVKCLSSSEVQESVPVQSQLNPYAKPFVMKSFFNSESEAKSSSFTSSELDASLISSEEHNTKLENQLVTGTVTEIISEKDINLSVTSSTTENVPVKSELLNQSVIDNVITPEHNVHLDQASFSENVGDKFSTEQDISLSVAENNSSEQLINFEQTVTENIIVDHLLQNDISRNVMDDRLTNTSSTEHDQISYQHSEISDKENVFENNPKDAQEENKLSDVSDLLTETVENVKLESSLVSENIQAGVMNILPSSEESKNSNLSPLSPKSTVSEAATPECESAELITQSAASFKESVSEHNQNVDLGNVLINLSPQKTTEIISEYESKYEALQKNVDDKEYHTNIQIKTIEQNMITESTAQSVISSEESNKPEHNQNADEGNVSGGLNSENTSLIEAELKSKCEEIQKCIVDCVEKNEIPETSSLNEPMSIVNIKDELIPTEAEVPSDPSAEDSRVETVAVDLKSLPEGIPEAEGVTEDIDSDSEKDGGWSYMKGNILSGSKSKSDEKAPKTTKTNEIKSNVTPLKGKRDISKPNVDLKSKMKTAALDKPKSTLGDKSKSVSNKTKIVSLADKTKAVAPTDKTKTVAPADKIKTVTPADKIKTVTPADKTKTVVSVDKNKKAAIEKKFDVKPRVIKSSVLPAAAKVTTDKTTRGTTMSSSKKEISETTKTTSTVTKSSKPSTLLRTSAPATKPVSSTVIDRSTSNKTAAKPKANSGDKTDVKNISASTLTKGQTNTQNKSSTISARTVPVRPVSTVPSRSSTVTKSTLQKPATSESKLKQTTTTTTLKKPLTTAAKKPDVKEVKDSVNKQILAKKTTTTSKVESSSTLVNKRIVSVSNKSTVSKVSSIATKSEVSKRDVPKAPALKSVVKNTGSKVTQHASKSKEKIAESVQSKTDETKNNLNIESDQKNVTEIVQVTEEKFILETSDKEKVAKEKGEISKEEQVVVENGSLTNPVTPVKVEMPVMECAPENL